MTKPEKKAPPGRVPDMTEQWPPSLRQAARLLRGSTFDLELPFKIPEIDRAWAAARIDQLMGLTKGDPDRIDEISAALSRLFLAYPAAKLGEKLVLERARTYVSVVGDLPSWAVVTACERWIRRDVPSSVPQPDANALDYPPSSARLRDMCNFELVPFRSEVVALQRALDARYMPEQTPEQRRATIERLMQKPAPTAP